MSYVDELIDLKKLLDLGIISQQEFETKKQQILAQASNGAMYGNVSMNAVAQPVHVQAPPVQSGSVAQAPVAAPVPQYAQYQAAATSASASVEEKDWNWGWWFLGLILGPIGWIVSLCIKNNPGQHGNGRAVGWGATWSVLLVVLFYAVLVVALMNA